MPIYLENGLTSDERRQLTALRNEGPKMIMVAQPMYDSNGCMTMVPQAQVDAARMFYRDREIAQLEARGRERINEMVSSGQHRSLLVAAVKKVRWQEETWAHKSLDQHASGYGIGAILAVMTLHFFTCFMADCLFNTARKAKTSTIATYTEYKVVNLVCMTEANETDADYLPRLFDGWVIGRQAEGSATLDETQFPNLLKTVAAAHGDTAVVLVTAFNGRGMETVARLNPREDAAVTYAGLIAIIDKEHDLETYFVLTTMLNA